MLKPSIPSILSLLAVFFSMHKCYNSIFVVSFRIQAIMGGSEDHLLYTARFLCLFQLKISPSNKLKDGPLWSPQTDVRNAPITNFGYSTCPIVLALYHSTCGVFSEEKLAC